MVKKESHNWVHPHLQLQQMLQNRVASAEGQALNYALANGVIHFVKSKITVCFFAICRQYLQCTILW